jgi:hypothetical protein
VPNHSDFEETQSSNNNNNNLSFNLLLFFEMVNGQKIVTKKNLLMHKNIKKKNQKYKIK